MTENFFTPRQIEPVQEGATRVVPEQPRTPEKKDNLAPPFSKEWLTVQEAQDEFRRLGLPRSVEAIRKYCRQGKVEANSIAGPKGDQHMIKSDSIRTFVSEQLQVLQAASRNVPVQPGTFQDNPVHPGMTRHIPVRADRPEPNAELAEKAQKQEKEIERLKGENRDLSIDKEVRARMNDVLEKDRDRLVGQVKEIATEAQEWSRKYGQLEERVQHLQLVAPSQPVSGKLKSDEPVEARQQTRPTFVHHQSPRSSI